jgi:hypothetical protein
MKGEMRFFSDQPDESLSVDDSLDRAKEDMRDSLRNDPFADVVHFSRDRGSMDRIPDLILLLFFCSIIATASVRDNIRNNPFDLQHD